MERTDEKNTRKGKGTWNKRTDESYDFGEHNDSDLKDTNGPHRPDEHIREDIKSRLTDDGFVNASEIEVTVASGKVILTGAVPDKSSKRRAEDISELVAGENNVESRLRVK